MSPVVSIFHESFFVFKNCVPRFHVFLNIW